MNLIKIKDWDWISLLFYYSSIAMKQIFLLHVNFNIILGRTLFSKKLLKFSERPEKLFLEVGRFCLAMKVCWNRPSFSCGNYMYFISPNFRHTIFELIRRFPVFLFLVSAIETRKNTVQSVQLLDNFQFLSKMTHLQIWISCPFSIFIWTVYSVHSETPWLKNFMDVLGWDLIQWPPTADKCKCLNQL